MRVTHRMIAESVSHNLNCNLYRLQQRSNQLSMGKVFDRPSQDPVGTYKVMQLASTSMAKNEQYRRNIDGARLWLQATEDVLAEAGEVMQRLRELAVYAANDTMTPADRKTLVPEVEQMLDHLAGLANAELNGLYLFGGHRTTARPYEWDEAAGSYVYRGDDGRRSHEITPYHTVDMNITGSQAFRGTGTLETVMDMKEALENSDTDALNDIIGRLEAEMENLIQRRAEVGARLKRLESTDSRLHSEHIYLREMRSKVEDLDFAEAVTEYMMVENTYRAALATGARMIQPSLADFLR